MQVVPRISFLLACRSGKDQLVIPPHSVLLVTARDGTEMVMDGTLQQYGWASETWLQSFSDFLATRVDTRKTPYCGFPSEERKDITREYASITDGGYWAVAQERMTKLFGELDWEELRSLGTAERLKRVKKQADERFAGANKETCEKYSRQQDKEQERS